jgi:cytoskeletal protein RodZ
MTPSFNFIWLELLLGFLVPIAFGVWQLQSVKKERAAALKAKQSQQAQGDSQSPKEHT